MRPEYPRLALSQHRRVKPSGRLPQRPRASTHPSAPKASASASEAGRAGAAARPPDGAGNLVPLWAGVEQDEGEKAAAGGYLSS